VTDTAASAPLVESLPDSPYVGLDYFTEEYAGLFFGREAERKRIIGNLRASRLTLLYAESGVGKSSLLRAGVAARLRELAERGPVRYVPVVFSVWGDDPVEGLVEAVEEATRPLVEGGEELTLPRDDLEGAIATAAERSGATVLIVLDQFEEYFLYHSREGSEGAFADQLARCVNDPNLGANFVIAIREDSYARLGDLFKGRIANVYGNYLHLDYLDRDAARDAILKPLELFSAERPGAEPFEIEPALVDAVLRQVERGHVESRNGARSDSRAKADGVRRVETTYLQLVMKRLWDEETAAGSHRLRLSTLERLGGAQTIIGSHLDNAMGELPPEQQDAAASAFRFLVTTGGTKIALTVADLSDLSELPATTLDPVLRRLSAGDLHILRPVAQPGSVNGSRYEIFHDALARPILDWRVRYSRGKKERELAARVEEERAEKEKAQRRARIFRAMMIACLVAVLGAAAGLAVALLKQDEADDQARRADSIVIARRAIDAADDPNLGVAPAVLAGLEAEQLARSPESEEAVHSRLQENAGMPEVLTGPRGGVYALAYSPRSGVLASGGADWSIRLWDRNGAEIGRPLWTSASKSVTAVAFNPRDDTLAAGRSDGAIDLWAVTGGQHRRLSTLKAGDESIETVAFSPDGRLLASGADDNRIRLWDVADPGKPVSLPAPNALADDVQGLVFNPDGSVLAAADYSGTVTLWRLSGSGPPTLRNTLQEAKTDDDHVWSLALSPDGRTLAAGASSGGIYLWNVSDPEKAEFTGKLVGHADSVRSVAFASDAILVSGGEDDNVLVWDLETGRTFGPPRGHVYDTVKAVAVSPDGNTVASGGDDGLVRLWNLGGAGALARTLNGDTHEIWDVAIGPDRQVASAGGARGAILWPLDGASGTHAPASLGSLRHEHGDTFAVEFHGDVLAAGDGKTFSLWRIGARQEPLLLDTAKSLHTDDVWELAFSPNGAVLASSAYGDTKINLWDVSDPKSIRLLKQLPGRGKEINALAFSPLGGVLAAGDEDGFVRLWDVRDPKQPKLAASLEADRDGFQIYSLAFSPDGKLLAVGAAHGAVTLFDVRDPLKPQRIARPLAQSDSIVSLAFSPDGAILASGDADGDVVLWDVATRRSFGCCLNGLHESSSGVSAIDTLAFDPSGRELVTAGRSNPLVAWNSALWSRDLTTLRAEGCRLAGRNLTQEEWNELFRDTRLENHRHKTCPEYPLP
jgi:WD40 repeat protein